VKPPSSARLAARRIVETADDDMHSRRTLLDGLPLLTVIGLCTLMVVVVRSRIDPALAEAPRLGPPGDAESALLTAAVQPPTTPWGYRTAAEMLEQVFDPPAERDSSVFPKPPPEGAAGDAPPAAEEPFKLEGARGVALAEGTLRGGRPHGPWIFRDSDGSLRARGSFADGAPDGEWESWHRDGTRRSRLRYEEGRARGARVDWWPNGVKALEGHYIEGLREGLWRTWHSTGALRSEGCYSGGLRQGAWSEWHLEGQLAASGSFSQGQRDGLHQAWFPNGQAAEEGHFLAGRREGLWGFFERDGSRDPRSGYYVAGVLQRP
jgi:antitoxin component YwqK of YwqJK toxin-antitoxin module